MQRKIIVIDREKCNGCGLCVDACHEGALRLVDGKAQLVSESYCDGLGACLPVCPTGALTIEDRDVAPGSPLKKDPPSRGQPVGEDADPPSYGQNNFVGTGGTPSSASVTGFQRAASAAAPVAQRPAAHAAGGCPGSLARTLARPAAAAPEAAGTAAPSALRQWPCQIKLVPVNAPWFDDADLLIAADCTAFASAALHRDFMPGKITLIGCPKLDGVDYAEKLTAILAAHAIHSVTVLRMEVPCCGGLAAAAQRACAASGKSTPCRIVTIGTDGRVQ